MNEIMLASLLIFALCGTTTLMVGAETFLHGENVCNETRHKPIERLVSVPIKYEITVSGMCGILPCEKKRIETRVDTRLETDIKEITVTVCCPGYTETPNKQCAPVCWEPCGNGKCVAPNVCKCSPEPTENTPGFVGSSCNRFACLASNRWGSKCDKECNCPSSSYCSANTGKCLCKTGWRGANCTEACDPSTNCQDVELPPIIEPEANVVSDDQSAQKLVLSQYRDNDDASMQSTFNLYATNISTHLFLISLVAMLFYAAIKYKRRYDRVRNELYYGAGSGSGHNDSSNYSVYSQSTNRSIGNRPRMPAPHEANFFDKNLSFAAATRNIVLKGALDPSHDSATKKGPETKAEGRLLKCLESSKPNIYSDIDSNSSAKSCTVIECDNESIQDPLTVSTIEEGHYLVPRSPVAYGIDSSTSSIEDETHAKDLYENPQNLYEEIKPRSSPNQDEKY